MWCFDVTWKLLIFFSSFWLARPSAFNAVWFHLHKICCYLRHIIAFDTYLHLQKQRLFFLNVNNYKQDEQYHVKAQQSSPINWMCLHLIFSFSAKTCIYRKHSFRQHIQQISSLSEFLANNIQPYLINYHDILLFHTFPWKWL
jgi:thioredoxin-related protein